MEERNMTTRNESRSNTLREENTREDEWTFEEPNALTIPDTVQARFANDGMSLRWIRISIRGQEDIQNVGKKLQLGWAFVAPDEVPEMALTSFVRDEGRYQGAVCRGDVALGKIPTNRVVAKKRYFKKSN